MNRREALELLASLPAVGTVKRVDVQPDSIVILECASEISQETATRLQASLRQVFPEPIKIGILCGGMTLRVLDPPEGKP